jgi:hypothetical protein
MLQHNKNDIDYIDDRSDRVGDDPPNGGWGISKVLFNHISNQLMLVLLEELE